MENYSEEEIKNFKDAFNMFDKDSSGFIDSKELGVVMRALDQNPTDKELEEMIKEKDLNGDGTIDFEEFVKTMSNNSKSEDEYCQEFKEAFACFDKDKSGTITKQELKEVLTQLGGSPLSDEEADAMIKEADLNNDGVLNMEELSKMLSKPSKSSDEQKPK